MEENLKELALHELKDLLIETIKKAEDEFFNSKLGVTPATQYKLRCLMFEFDNHLTFSAL